MPDIRPWRDVLAALQLKSATADSIFDAKGGYFDIISGYYGLSPEDHEEKKHKFLYGDGGEWEVFKALKSGFIRGLGEVPEAGADILGLGQKLIPGESEWAPKAEGYLRDVAEYERKKAEDYYGGYRPSSAPERIAYNLGNIPGIIGAASPYIAAGGLVAAALPISAPLAAVAGGALGFGAFEAIGAQEGGAGEMLRAGGHGAALGGALGAGGYLARGVGGPGLLGTLKSRAATGGAAGTAAGATDLLLGAGPEQALETAATMGILGAVHANQYEKIKRIAEKNSIDPDILYPAVEAARRAEAEAARIPREKRDEFRRKQGLTTTEKEIREDLFPKRSNIELDEPVEPRTPEEADVMYPDPFLKKADEISHRIDLLEEPVQAELPIEPTATGALALPFKTRRTQTAKQGGAVHEVLWDGKRTHELRFTGDRENKEWTLVDLESGKETPYPSYNEARTAARVELSYRPAPQNEIGVGVPLMHGLKLMAQNDRVARTLGRRLTWHAAKKLGLEELVEQTRPISPTEASIMIGEVTEITLSDGFTRGFGELYVPEHYHARLESYRDVPALLHAVGHWAGQKIHEVVNPDVKMRPGVDYEGKKEPGSQGPYHIFRQPKSGETAKGSFYDLFQDADAAVFDRIGKEVYSDLRVVPEESPTGEKGPPVKPGDRYFLKPSERSSYAAEGFAEVIRRRLSGEDLKVGPELEDKLNAYIAETPGLAEKLYKVGTIFDKLMQQEPKQTVAASIRDGKRKFLADPKSRLGETIYQYLFFENQGLLNAFDKTAKALGVKKVRPEKDPRFVLDSLSNAAIAQRAIGFLETGFLADEYGPIDLKTKVTNKDGSKGFEGDSYVRAVHESGLVAKEYGVKGGRDNLNNFLALSELQKLQDGMNKYLKIRERAQAGGDITPFENAGQIRSFENKISSMASKFGVLLGEPVRVNSKGSIEKVMNSVDKAYKDMLKEFPNAVVVERAINNTVKAIEEIRMNPRSGGLRRNEILEELFGKQLPFFSESPAYLRGSSTIKKLSSGTERITDPASGIYKYVEDSIREVAHNKIMNIVQDIRKAGKFSGIDIGDVKTEDDIKPLRTKGNVDLDALRMIEFYDGGTKKYFQFSEKPEGISAWRGLKSGSELFMGGKWVDTIFGAPKRAMTLGTTGANVGFLLLTNPQRDTMTRTIQTAIPESRGPRGLLDAVESARDLLTMGLTAMTKPWELERVYGEKGNLYRKYLGSGVKGSSIIGADIRSRKAQVDWMIMQAQKSNSNVEKVFEKNGLKSFMVKHPVEFLRRAFNLSEDLNRFPEFAKMMESTKEEIVNAAGERIVTSEGSVPRATKAAAEVSIDFKRAGIAGRLINQFVPFFNPSLQGLDKFNRTLFKDGKPSIKNIDRGVLYAAGQMVTLPTFALWAMNHDEEWHKELPTWEKIIFNHVRIGETVFRIPVPFEWGIMFGTLPALTTFSIMDDATPDIKEGMMTALKSMIPYDFMLDVQAVKPAFEAAANKNFFTGLPIESQAMQRRLPSDRYMAGTHSTYRAGAKVFEAVGLGKLKLDSPLVVEHLVRGYFGGAVHEAIGSMEALLGVATGQGLPDRPGLEQTVLRRLISPSGRPGKSVNDFYEQLDIADKAWTTAKRNIKSGDKDTARKVLIKYGKILGLRPSDADRLVNMYDPPTPQKLLEWKRKSVEIAQLKKQDDIREMNEIAQALLGKDWD